MNVLQFLQEHFLVQNSLWVKPFSRCRKLKESKTICAISARQNTGIQLIIVQVTKCGFLSEDISLYLLLPIVKIWGLLVGFGEAPPRDLS